MLQDTDWPLDPQDSGSGGIASLSTGESVYIQLTEEISSRHPKLLMDAIRTHIISLRENGYPISVRSRYLILLRNEPMVSEPIAAEMLGELRRIFGLNVSELSTIFRVTRRTILKWLNGGSPRNRKRLNEIYHIAIEYRDKGIGSVARHLKSSINDMPSLFDLLSADSLDSSMIATVLDHFLEGQLRKAAFRSRASEIAEQHGFDRLTEEEQEANIAHESFSVS